MSSVIKINRSGANSGFRLQNVQDTSLTETEGQDEYWKRQLEAEREKYYNEGRNQALAEMEMKYSQSLFGKYGQFDDIINSISDQFVEYTGSFEKIVTELSFLIAEKIIRKKIEEESIVVETIKNATQKILGADAILIKVNPSDYDLLKESGKDLFRDESFSKVKFERDNKIEIGGCFIESEIGNVDARLSTQINELKNLIANNPLNEQ